MSKMKITVGGAMEDEAARRFVDAWHRAGRGESFRERHLAFESWDALARVLTGKRLELLRYIRWHKVTSVRALAKALGRDYSNVHADVQALIAAGLLDATDGNLRAEYDAIEARIAIIESTSIDRHYPREEALVKILATRLRLMVGQYWNPNTPERQSGVDVAFRLNGGRCIGVQVTEIDPFLAPGARGREKKQALEATGGVYGNFAPNDPAIILDAFARSMRRKAGIAAHHDLSAFSEVWLLLCGGVPDAPTATFIPTGPLSAADLDAATGNILIESKFDRCFILLILNTEKAFYQWSKGTGTVWKKTVELEENLGPNDATYIQKLIDTAGRDESVVDQQVSRVLQEERSRRDQ
jgi:predicted transcriptional regulator